MGATGTADTGGLSCAFSGVAVGLAASRPGAGTDRGLCLRPPPCRRRRRRHTGRIPHGRLAAVPGPQGSQLWSCTVSHRRGRALSTFYSGEWLSTRARLGVGAADRELSARTDVFSADQPSSELLYVALSRLIWLERFHPCNARWME